MKSFEVMVEWFSVGFLVLADRIRYKYLFYLLRLMPNKSPLSEGQKRLKQAFNSARWSLEPVQNLKDSAHILAGDRDIKDVKRDKINEDFSYNESKDRLEFRLSGDCQTLKAYQLMKGEHFSGVVKSAAKEALEQHNTFEIYFETDIGWEGQVHNADLQEPGDINGPPSIVHGCFYDPEEDYDHVSENNGRMNKKKEETQNYLAFQAESVAERYLESINGE